MTSLTKTVPSRFHPLQDSFERLSRVLRKSNFPSSALDIEGCLLGIPNALIPPLRHLLFEVSKQTASEFADKYGLSPTNAYSKLVEIAFKILRFDFDSHPQITVAQFLGVGFAQKKIEVVCVLAEKLKKPAMSFKSSKVPSESSREAPQPAVSPGEPSTHPVTEPPTKPVNPIDEILSQVETLNLRFTNFQDRLETISARLTLLETDRRISIALGKPSSDSELMAKAAETIRGGTELLQKLELRKLNIR